MKLFEYGGISSAQFGLSLDKEKHHLMPEQKRYVKDVVGVDGVIDYGIGGYGVRTIAYDVFYDGDYKTLRANIHNITGWLSNVAGQPKVLRFEDEPGIFYMSKVYANLTFENTSDRKIGTIAWECNPPWAYLDNQTPLSPEEINARLLWDTATYDTGFYIQNFTANGYMRMTVPGDIAIKPVIKLIGTIKQGFKMVYGVQEWQYDGDVLYDGIIIDCFGETVTKASDGSNLFANVNATKDDYFSLEPGEIQIDVTGTFAEFPEDLNILFYLQGQVL